MHKSYGDKLSPKHKLFNILSVSTLRHQVVDYQEVMPDRIFNNRDIEIFMTASFPPERASHSVPCPRFVNAECYYEVNGDRNMTAFQVSKILNLQRRYGDENDR
ncbi:hypothetical protein EIO60_01324|nr:hypothetical protein [Candidatus Pantoea persica]